MSFKIVLPVCLVLCLPSLADAQSTPQPVPRTAWGAPDLQGVYDFGTVTPFQRPAALAGRETFTEEEAVVQEQLNADRWADDVNTDNLTPPNYNNFWFDFGDTVVPTMQTSLIVDPPDGRLPAVTPQQERKAAAERAAGGYPVRLLSAGGIGVSGPEDRGLAERCLLGFNSGPPAMPSAYNNYLQVFQTPDHVVILTEMVHEARIVPLDGRDRRPREIPQWLGTPRGWWEGDTVVIETMNFRDERGFPFRPGVGPTEQTRLTERLTRVDGDTLLYEYTYDDPEVFTRPFSVSIPLRRTDSAVFEYACHEGNYGLMNILEGARAEEAAEGP